MATILRGSNAMRRIRVFLIATCIIAVTPRLSAEITLVSRYSAARADASVVGNFDSPPPNEQHDFLPASLDVLAAVDSIKGGQITAETQTSSAIVVDNSMGTMGVMGEASIYTVVFGLDADGEGAANLITLTFTLSDSSYSYSLSGGLRGNGSYVFGTPPVVAKLTTATATIFEVPPTEGVTLSENGTLPPDTYTLTMAVSGFDFVKELPEDEPAHGNFDFELTAAPTPTPTPVPTPTPSPAPAQPLNLSTRMLVQTGDDVAVVGFIITGTDPKRVILRGLGPSLLLSGALADPVLELRNASGQLIASNDDWCPPSPCLSCCDVIFATGLAPQSGKESAIVATLNPGAYTAILRGKNDTSGVALIEIYDLNAATADSKLANLSTRAFVSGGNDIVIAGFFLGNGSGDDTVVVRGVGPSLTGVTALGDPKLELRNQNGEVVRADDNWMDDPSQKALIIAAGLAPSNNLESAIAATLMAGPYTALLSGVNNGTGVGLVEIYDLGVPTP